MTNTIPTTDHWPTMLQGARPAGMSAHYLEEQALQNASTCYDVLSYAECVQH